VATGSFEQPPTTTVEAGTATTTLPIPDADYRTPDSPTLYDEVQSWDPTRLLCDNSGWAHVATDINDYHEYFVTPDRVDAR